jgi:hypothetical protein
MNIRISTPVITLSVIHLLRVVAPFVQWRLVSHLLEKMSL